MLATVTLQSIVIRYPNPDCIYSLSKFRPIKLMDYEEFWSEYIADSCKVRVCFTDDRPTLENSVEVKAYGFSYEGWYMLQIGTMANKCQNAQIVVQK